MKQIVYGELTESFMGYSIGAKIYCYLLNSNGGFYIVHDLEDKFWGYAFHTSFKPKIKVIESIVTNEVEETRFFTYLNLIRQKIEIPIEIPLNFTFENDEKNSEH